MNLRFSNSRENVFLTFLKNFWKDSFEISCCPKGIFLKLQDRDVGTYVCFLLIYYFLIKVMLANGQHLGRIVVAYYWFLSKKVLSMRERIRELKLMLGESIFLRHNSLKLKRDYFRCKLKGLRHLFNEELNIVIPKYECISFVSWSNCSIAQVTLIHFNLWAGEIES